MEPKNGEGFAYSYLDIARACYSQESELQEVRDNIPDVIAQYQKALINKPPRSNFDRANLLIQSAIPGQLGLFEAAVMIGDANPLFDEWRKESGQQDDLALRYYLDVALSSAKSSLEKLITDHIFASTDEERDIKFITDTLYRIAEYNRLKERLWQKISPTPPQTRK